MVDPDDPPEIQIEKQKRIIDALIRRAEHGNQIGDSAYALFNSAITLQSQVWARTKDLENALHTLGYASSQLESSEEARREATRNLADAVEAMESGFALFSEDRLQICNQLLRTFLPDLSRRIRVGMSLEAFLQALTHSRFVQDRSSADAMTADHLSRSLLLGVQGDRWFQVALRETDSGNMVVLLTEVTRVIRRNRLEREELIDGQARFLQTAFEHMNFGVATFSAEGMLAQTNTRFRTLLELPLQLVEKGTILPQILEYLEHRRMLFDLGGGVDFSALYQDIETEADAQWQVQHINGAVLDITIHVLPDASRLIILRDTSVERAAQALLEERVASRTLDLTRANEKLQQQNAELEKTRGELTEARDKAEAAVRSKTRFLAAASHDLLQPANAAKLFLSTMMDKARDGPMFPALERLSLSLDSLETQLNALLDISRLESTGVEFGITEFPVQSLLSQIEADTAPVAQQKGLELRVLPSRHWVRSDQRYLVRSVQNLVLNALQYTPKGRVLLGCRKRGPALMIEVWDTGVGISPQDQSRIFEAFTRVKNGLAGKGMGLGLSIVDQACRQLGHKVTLRSKPGAGSMFRVEVPLCPPQEPPEPVEPAAPEQGKLDLIIMVVEDDPSVLQATTERLEAWGASVLPVTSTAEANALTKSIGMAPDIMIVDYQLQDGDSGVDTIAQIRAQTDMHIPAIMITADRSEELQFLAIEHDFTVLTKPIRLTQLRPLIAWKTQNPPRDKSSG